LFIAIKKNKNYKVKVINNIEEFEIEKSVVTVGTFDGLHRGHQKIINTLINAAKQRALPSVVFTFWPHPRFVLGKADGLELLNTIEEKAVLLEKLGVDYLVSVEFNKDFANQTSYEFVKNVLVAKLNVNHLVLGYDHHFGKNREGRFDKLQTCGQEFGFSVEQVSALKGIGENISSTKIRNLLKAGNIPKANNYLGYNYFISGEVVHGDKIGRKIGFPTANISVPDFKLKPANGVYAVFAEVEGKKYKAMTNIGRKPTFKNDASLSIETHIFDFAEELYGKKISISFLEKIRDEITFDSSNQLAEQLKKDREDAVRLLE